MTSKDALKIKLKELPPGFTDVLGATMPVLADIAVPADVDAAIIAQGLLANYLIEIFNRLGGLELLEVPLRIGEFVPALHAMAAVGLEFVGAKDGGEITMIIPTNGAVYYGALTEVRCEVSNVSGVTVDDGNETFDLSQESGDVWGGLWPFAIGSHSITVTAGEESLSVSFEVAFWDTYPVSGESYASPLERLEVMTEAQTDDIEQASVSIAGETYQLVKSASAWIWEEAVSIVSGEIQAIFQLTIDGETIEDIIYFTIHQEE